MKHRNILLAVAVGLIAALGLIAPVHAGDLAGVLPAFNVFGSVEGAGLAMLALAMSKSSSSITRRSGNAEAPHAAVWHHPVSDIQAP